MDLDTDLDADMDMDVVFKDPALFSRGERVFFSLKDGILRKNIPRAVHHQTNIYRVKEPFTLKKLNIFWMLKASIGKSYYA